MIHIQKLDNGFLRKNPIHFYFTINTYSIGILNNEIFFNYEKAVCCFEKAAKFGQTDALIRLGTMHLHGVGVIPPDLQMAFSYFSQAAQTDNSLGWEWAAYCHYWGYGTQKNMIKAQQFYHKAAQEGSCHSQYMLGVAANLSCPATDVICCPEIAGHPVKNNAIHDQLRKRVK